MAEEKVMDGTEERKPKGRSAAVAVALFAQV